MESDKLIVMKMLLSDVPLLALSSGHLRLPPLCHCNLLCSNYMYLLDPYRFKVLTDY